MLMQAVQSILFGTTLIEMLFTYHTCASGLSIPLHNRVHLAENIGRIILRLDLLQTGEVLAVDVVHHHVTR